MITTPLSIVRPLDIVKVILQYSKSRNGRPLPNRRRALCGMQGAGPAEPYGRQAAEKVVTPAKRIHY